MAHIEQTPTNGNGRPWTNGQRNPDMPARSNDPLEVIKSLINHGVGVVRLTAAQAGLILRETRYERQNRDLLPSGEVHITVLAEQMRNDQWRAKDKLDFALLNGRLILMNGHHRLGAQVASGKKVEWVVVVHRCADDDAVARLYATFDANLKLRSNAQVLNAANLHEYMEIPKMLSEAIFGAVPLLANGIDFKKTAKNPLIDRIFDTRIELAKEYKVPAQAWAKAIEPASAMLRRRLTTHGATAVAITTFIHREKKAKEFWHAVANNDCLPRGTPEHSYVQALTSTNHAKGNASATARAAATAWNAFYAGRALTFIRFTEENHIRIAGTPIGK